jgi:hypothetical protein
MKRFTVATALFSVSILVIWMVFHAFTTSSAKTHDASSSAGNSAIVPVTGAQVREVAPAPVYDASGKIQSLNPNGSSNEAIILAPAANVKIAPVYDATGQLISDPTGTLNSSPAGVHVAPVFDSTGAVVSDPSGTLANGSNP